MKRITALLILILLILLIGTACSSDANGETTSGTTPTLDQNAPLSDGKTLKVLAIGNSFSNNTTEYLYDIAKAEGMTDVVIGRLYIGGCALKTHVENAQGNKADYTYYKNDSGLWNKMDKITLLYALQDEQWDIITMQQASSSSGEADTYSESVGELISYVNKNKTNANAQLVWHMTWAYQEDNTSGAFAKYNSDQITMYNAISKAVQEVIVPMSEFRSIIPVGTAIQNARTSFIGDNLTSDATHLNELGMVIGAYTWYSVFTEKELETINLTEIRGKLILTDNDKAAIIDAVNAAVKAPFVVTQSSVLAN